MASKRQAEKEEEEEEKPCLGLGYGEPVYKKSFSKEEEESGPSLTSSSLFINFQKAGNNHDGRFL